MSNEPKHSAGPWRAYDSEVEDSSGYLVAECNTRDSEFERHANADLISRAPDLLAENARLAAELAAAKARVRELARDSITGQMALLNEQSAGMGATVEQLWAALEMMAESQTPEGETFRHRLADAGGWPNRKTGRWDDEEEGVTT